jgi:nucleotide-binding universal stress UspA family protein
MHFAGFTMPCAQGIDATRISTVPSTSRGLGNVLVATDFSAVARTAVARAAHLPFSAGGRLELIHVLPERRSATIADAEARERLDEVRDSLLPAVGGPAVVISVGHGQPAAVLCDRARHSRAELIVIGRHGTRSVEDMLIGTTAERVVRHGSTSTLIVMTPAGAPYRRPLVAVDLSESSRLALDLAARISRPPGDEIAVLHVVSSESDRDNPVIHASTLELRRELILGDAHRKLSAFLSTTNLPVRWRSAIQFGEPGSRILEAARQHGSDLIVVGSTGKGTLRRALLGSVAEIVMGAATCDVIVARLPEVNP